MHGNQWHNGSASCAIKGDTEQTMFVWCFLWNKREIPLLLQARFGHEESVFRTVLARTQETPEYNHTRSWTKNNHTPWQQTKSFDDFLSFKHPCVMALHNQLQESQLALFSWHISICWAQLEKYLVFSWLHVGLGSQHCQRFWDSP